MNVGDTIEFKYRGSRLIAKVKSIKAFSSLTENEYLPFLFEADVKILKNAFAILLYIDDKHQRYIYELNGKYYVYANAKCEVRVLTDKEALIESI